MEWWRKAVLAALRPLEIGAEWSCQGALAVMSAVVLLQVVLRYVFLAPLVWAEEASVFLMIWVTFIGSGIAIRRKAHVAMTVVADRLSAGLARTVLVCSNIAIVAFLAVVAWQGFRLATFVVDQPSPAMRVSMIWPYMAIPLGALFMISQILAAAFDRPDARASPGGG